MKNVSLIALLGCVTLAAGPANAWNYAGHRVIASIAYRELDPETRDRVAVLLIEHPAYRQFWRDRANNGPDGRLNVFYNASVWPDDARYEPWKAFGRSEAHYVNFRIMAEEGNRILPPVKGENVLNSFVGHVRKLGDPKTPDSERANHLAWIFHQVGDVHMPLHAVARFSRAFPRGDRGGNDVQVPNPTARTERGNNLHAYWDDLIATDEDPAAIERIAGELIVAHPRSNFAAELRLKDIGQWAEESAQVSVNTVYRDLDREQRNFAQLPIGYQAEARNAARKRAALAGYRLADQLRESFPPEVGK